MEIDKDSILNRFTIIQSPRLFDTERSEDWNLIKQGICPICSCNLKVSKKGDVFCNSKKHKTITKKGLFIRAKSFPIFNS